MQYIKTHIENYRKCEGRKIRYLVLHEVQGRASQHINATHVTTTSVHYLVDGKKIIQTVADTDVAWHCGTRKQYYHAFCRNENAIGIALCRSGERFSRTTLQCAAELTRELMQRYNIPTRCILRHYDVTHKICPMPFVKDTRDWKKFLKLVGR